jgi:hypothetical protein
MNPNDTHDPADVAQPLRSVNRAGCKTIESVTQYVTRPHPRPDAQSEDASLTKNAADS